MIPGNIQSSLVWEDGKFITDPYLLLHSSKSNHSNYSTTFQQSPQTTLSLVYPTDLLLTSVPQLNDLSLPPILTSTLWQPTEPGKPRLP